MTTNLMQPLKNPSTSIKLLRSFSYTAQPIAFHGEGDSII